MADTPVALSVALACYQEAENLRILLPQLHSVLDTLNVPYEILIIDRMRADDETPAICKTGNARYINRKNSDHYGAAIRTAIAHANGEHTIFMDADGSHRPEYIPAMYALKDSYDVVIASRYVAGGTTQAALLMQLLSKTVNRVFSRLTGGGVRDVSTSYKLYRTRDLRALSLTSDHFDILQEILGGLRARNPALRIKEIPITFENRLHGKSKRQYWLFLLSYLGTLRKLRRNR
jgi:dolichol-phosphate mannosyltransferase